MKYINLFLKIIFTNNDFIMIMHDRIFFIKYFTIYPHWCNIILKWFVQSCAWLMEFIITFVPIVDEKCLRN